MKDEKVMPSQSRWMVVDDDPNVLNALALLLQKLSQAEVWRFSSGAEALAAFSAAPEFFQFVVTDFDMPGMNGQELCHRLRALSPSLKILLATGSADFTPAAARQNGFCGLLPKPFPPGALRQALETAGVLNGETVLSS